MRLSGYVISFVLVMALLTGYIIIMLPTVSATPVIGYVDENFDSGIGTWSGSGAISTITSHSSPNSMVVGSGGYEYKNGLSSLFGPVTDYNVNLTFMYTSTSATSHSTLFVIGDNFGTYYSVWIDISPNGSINTVDFGNGQHFNESGLVASPNVWHTLQIKDFNGATTIQMKLDGSQWTERMWNQRVTGSPTLMMFGVLAVGTNIYYDDLKITSYVYSPDQDVHGGGSGGGRIPTNFIDTNLVNGILILLLLLIPSAIVGFIAGHVGFAMTVSVMSLLVMIAYPSFVVSALLIWIFAAVIVWTGDS